MIDYYFFDTYSVIELLKGNPNYLPFRRAKILLTKLNLFEIYYYLLRKVGQKIADEILKEYANFSIDYDSEVIRTASNMKYEFKKRKISMTDCIGYVLSKKHKIPFLTGDNQFKDLENVEFIK